MIKENQILKLYGTDYKEMTRRLLEEADLAGRIPGRDCLIGIKPNLVCPTPADYGATTHPEVVAGIIEYLQERGFSNLLMAEGSWVGDRTSEAYEYCGYRALSERYGVPFIDTKKEKSHEKDCAGMKLRISDIADRIGFLINVPVLKGHCQTKMTCALKNLKGCIPDSEKRQFHSDGLIEPIAALSSVLKPELIIVDSICGDLDYEEGGNPVHTNRMMLGTDPVQMDAYGCQLMGLDITDVPYIELAEEWGAGCAEVGEKDIVEAVTSEVIARNG